jgi:acyl-CoA thioester hydrolase
MTNWTETYRGAVPPWQCDVTEHFTVAYHFERLEEADANLADELGLGCHVAKNVEKSARSRVCCRWTERLRRGRE